MAQEFKRWMHAILFSLAGLASAAPALPASTVAEDAVRAALSLAPTPAPAAAVSAQSAAETRAASVAAAQATSPSTAPTTPLAQTPIRGRTAIVRATAYNSLVGQTDSTPFITATGTRTRPGVVALSRDLLRLFPYGTKIMIEDLSGRSNNLLAGRVFLVEDTMNARKTNSLDIWMSSRSEALRWGAHQVRITAVR